MLIMIPRITRSGDRENGQTDDLQAISIYYPSSVMACGYEVDWRRRVGRPGYRLAWTAGVNKSLLSSLLRADSHGVRGEAAIHVMNTVGLHHAALVPTLSSIVGT